MKRLMEQLGVTPEQKYHYDKLGVQITGSVDNLQEGSSDGPVIMTKDKASEEMIRNNTLLTQPYDNATTSGEGGSGGIWTVPDTGSRLPSGVGGFTYDFTRNELYKPGYDPSVVPMISEGQGIPSNYLRSMTIILDDHANGRILPGGAKFLIDACFIWTMPMRNLQIFHVVPPTVFVAQLIMNNTTAPVNPLPMSYSKERQLPENTITKVNGAGVIDNWTSTEGWLSSDGGTRGPANTKTFIHLMSYPSKNFQVKNTGVTNSVEIYLDAWNLGGQNVTMFTVPDPTTGVPGSLVLAPGDTANLQVNNYYHFMRLNARIPQANATGDNTTIECAYRGNTTS